METELLGKPEIELVENELDLEFEDLPRKPLPKLLVRATHGSANGCLYRCYVWVHCSIPIRAMKLTFFLLNPLLLAFEPKPEFA